MPFDLRYLFVPFLSNVVFHQPSHHYSTTSFGDDIVAFVYQGKTLSWIVLSKMSIFWFILFIFNFFDLVTSIITLEFEGLINFILPFFFPP